MRSKTLENKELTNQLENIRNIKHHLYLHYCVKIQGNVAKVTTKILVNNTKSSVRFFTNEHPTKSTNHKIETTEIEELKPTPAKDITEETTAEIFCKTFNQKIRML